MPTQAARVTVGATATLIATVDPFRAPIGLHHVAVKNASPSQSVFLGGPNVTAATGFELEKGETRDCEVSDSIYGVTASGTVVLHVLQH